LIRVSFRILLTDTTKSLGFLASLDASVQAQAFSRRGFRNPSMVTAL
jgi:hypothetical protein